MLDDGMLAMESLKIKRDTYMAEAQSNRLAKQQAPAAPWLCWLCRLCLRAGHWLMTIGGALERRAESGVQSGPGQSVHSLLRLDDTLPKGQPASTMH